MLSFPGLVRNRSFSIYRHAPWYVAWIVEYS